MDKETLSNYGWIVIAVLILAVMIALATPFGTFIENGIKSTTQGLFDVEQKALGAASIIIPDQTIAEPGEGGNGGSGGGSTPATGCDTLYWDGNTDGRAYISYEELSFYQISDIITTENDFFEGVKLTMNDGSRFDTFDPIETLEHDGFIFLIDIDCCVMINSSSTSCPKGVYFFSSEEFFLTSFTIHGYTGFPHSEHCGH